MTRYLSFYLFLFFLLSATHSFCQSAYITNRGDSSVSVINTLTNSVIATIAVNPHPSGVVVSPDGQRVYIAYYNATNNAVTVINTVTNSVIGEVPLNINSSFGGVIDISPDGKTVYVACLDTVFAVNTATLTIAAKIPTEKGNYIQGIAVSTDGLNVYVNGSEKIIVIDAKADTVAGIIPVKKAYFLQLAISPDNTKLYGADKLSGALHIINLLTSTSVNLQVAPQNTNCVCVSADGKRVYTSNYKDQTVSVIDGVADTLITSVKVNGISPFGISLTPDGSSLYIANFTSSNVNEMNTSTYEMMSSISVGKNPAALGKFIGGNSLLPLTLTRFSASLYNQDVKLKWQTENEINVSCFSVERSIDGIHFYNIGKVYATAKNAALYNYTDVNANSLFGTNTSALYYRLQTIDKDGKTIVSNIIIVKPATAIVSMYLLANPVKNTLAVRMHNYEGKAGFMIVDLSGKTCYTDEKFITSDSRISVNTSALKPGVYILHVTAGRELQQKFIKD